VSDSRHALNPSSGEPVAAPFLREPDNPLSSADLATGNEDAGAQCRSCGACCAYSREWPRFSIEDDAALALIPRGYVNDRESGMRCDRDRCSALTGEIGVATACAVYDLRPEVCRTCEPGDEACATARRRFGL